MNGQYIAFVLKEMGFRLNVLRPSPVHILQCNPQCDGVRMGGD